MKSTVLGRVSRVGVVTDNAVESEDVREGVGEEKTANFGEFSLLSKFSGFFAFSESIGHRDVAANVVGLVWVEADVVMGKGGSGLALV